MGKQITPNHHMATKKTKTTEEVTSAYLLKDYPLSSTDAARLIVELLEECPAEYETNSGLITHCRHIIHEGIRGFKIMRRTVSFSEAVQSMLAYKPGVRDRTRNEIRQICARIEKSIPEWHDVSVRDVDTAFCQQAIECVFDTVPMQRKARRILHSLFAFAVLNRWCLVNPVDLVVLRPYEEKPIQALKIEQVLALLRTARMPAHMPCAAAIGLMVWAGVRPNELVRLKQGDIHFDERVITVPARHAKTGGARHITMYPVLYHWLRSCMKYYSPEAPVVPTSWVARWARLRQAAGFTEWVPDVLRHTFASYHLKYYRDLRALQVDMGHASLELLRTRYLAMQGITAKGAAIFWEYGLPKSSRTSGE